jgi:hypothetical protein
MRGNIPPLPNTPSWRGAQIKKKAQGFHLYLLIFYDENIRNIFNVYHILKYTVY